jgi:hypothetical protein
VKGEHALVGVEPLDRGPMTDQSQPNDRAPSAHKSSADDRMVDVLRKFVPDRLADFRVGLADKIVGGCEPAQVGHSLQVPDDDARFHASKDMTHAGSLRKLLRRIRCQFYRLQN